MDIVFKFSSFPAFVFNSIDKSTFALKNTECVEIGKNTI